LANKLSRSERARFHLQKASEQEHNIASKTNFSQDQEGESTVRHEKDATEHGKESRILEIAASTLLLAASSVCQHIPTSKKSR